MNLQMYPKFNGPYEYQYKVGGITHEVSLQNSQLSFKIALTRRSIPLSYVHLFGITDIRPKNKEIDRSVKPDDIEPGQKALAISYIDPNNMKKKLITLNIDTNKNMCRSFLSDFHKKFRSKYVGFGPVYKVYKAIETPMDWVAGVVVLASFITLAAIILGIAYSW